MNSLPLTFREVRWGAEGGPVALLRIDPGNDYLSLDLTVEDAWALVAVPQQSGAERLRLGTLALTLLESAGGSLRGVQLVIGPDGLLRAELTINGAFGQECVLVHVADGLLLARQGAAPLSIAARDLNAHRTDGLPEAPTTPTPVPPDPLALFRNALAGVNWLEHDGRHP